MCKPLLQYRIKKILHFIDNEIYFILTTKKKNNNMPRLKIINKIYERNAFNK